MPLGLCYIAAYLMQNGFNVKIYDASLENRFEVGNGLWHHGCTKMKVLEIVAKQMPSIVGIGCFFSMRFPYVIEIAKTIKSSHPEIKIVIGGIHPTIFPKEILRDYNCIDYVVIGEGERSSVRLIRKILDNEKNNEIDGIAWREQNDIKVNQKKEFIDDLDSLALPARHMLPVEEYFQWNRNEGKWGLDTQRAMSVISSRSCPNKCTFCSMFHVHGKRWRPRSATNVVDEIEQLVTHFQIDGLYFEDDNFTYSKARVIKICEEIIKRGLKIKWNTPNGVSIKHLDYEILLHMKKAGCHSVNLPIESGDEYIRNNVIGKKVSNEKVVDIVRACRDLNLETNAYFVIGMPGETEKTLDKTLKLAEKLSLDRISVYYATPFPGTELFNHCESKKLIDEDYVNSMVSGKIKLFRKPIIKNTKISIKKLMERRQELLQMCHKPFTKRFNLNHVQNICTE